MDDDRDGDIGTVAYRLGIGTVSCGGIGEGTYLTGCPGDMHSGRNALRHIAQTASYIVPCVRTLTELVAYTSSVPSCPISNQVCPLA